MASAEKKMFMPISNNPLHVSFVQMQDHSIEEGQINSFQSTCSLSTAQSFKQSTPRVTAPKTVTWASPISKSVVLGSPEPDPMLLSSPHPPIYCPSSGQLPSSNPLKEPSEEDCKEITLLEIPGEYLQEASNTFGMSEVHPSWELVTRINLQHLFKELSSNTACLPIPLPPHPSPTSTTAGNLSKEIGTDRCRDRKRKQKDCLDKTFMKQDEAIVTLPVHHLPSLSSTSFSSSNHATMDFILETNPLGPLQKNFQSVGADDWNHSQHDDELQPPGGVGNEEEHVSTSSVDCSIPSVVNAGRKPIPPVTQLPSWHLAGIPIQGPLPEPQPHSHIAIQAMPTPVEQLQSSKIQPLERTEVISWVNGLNGIIYLQDKGHFGHQDFQKLKMLIQKIKANKAHPYLTAAVLAKTKLAVVLRKFQHKKYGSVLRKDARDINSFWRERLLGK